MDARRCKTLLLPSFDSFCANDTRHCMAEAVSVRERTASLSSPFGNAACSSARFKSSGRRSVCVSAKRASTMTFRRSAYLKSDWRNSVTSLSKAGWLVAD